MNFANKKVSGNRREKLRRIEEKIMNLTAFCTLEMGMFLDIRIKPHFAIFNDHALSGTAAAEQLQRIVDGCP